MIVGLTVLYSGRYQSVGVTVVRPFSLTKTLLALEDTGATQADGHHTL